MYIREPINGLTHLVGAILSVFGLFAMAMKISTTETSMIHVIAVILFGISMILLYSASATYHMVVARDKVIAFLRKIDHSMIFLLIAGSYAPFCLISLYGPLGITIFSIIMSLTIAGIIFKLVWFNCPRWLSTAIYIGMGWIAIFAIIPLAKALSFGGVSLLILGGVFYTIGGVIYGIKPNWNVLKAMGYHEIFHIFIMLGTLCHFFSVYLYVI